MIYLFNPENDLALAAHCATFTPPVAAAQLRDAGALLPVWMAGDGDAVICRDQPTADAGRRLASQLGVDCRMLLPGELRDFCAGETQFRPWGWNRSLRRSLMRYGVDGKYLPSDRQIDILREFSSRETTVGINRSVASVLGIDCRTATTAPVVCRSTAEASAAIADSGARGAVVKLPWSSSGRGVFATLRMSARQLTSVIEGALRRQGAVMVERLLPQLLDCAALFECRDGAVRFIGYSVFRNMHFADYGGNLIASQRRIRQEIAALVGEEALTQTIAALTDVLNSVYAPVAEFYNGHLGVDMLVWETPEAKPALAPCVEVNLRTTMGVVAMNVARHLIGDDTTVKLMRTAATAESESDTATTALSPVCDAKFLFRCDNFDN